MIVHYIGADWCGPCKMFKPIVQQVSHETGVHVNFVNADYDTLVTQKYSVTSIPCIVVADDKGNQLFKHVGPMGKQQLKEQLSKFR